MKLTRKLVLAKAKASDLESVKKLNCWGCNLTDISIFSQMPNIKVLTLSVNSISSLAPLAGCLSLCELYLRKNMIPSLSELSHLRLLTRLRVLWLAENPCCGTESSQYRLTVLRCLPRLQKLDNQVVTEDELALAIMEGEVVTTPPGSVQNHLSTNGLPDAETENDPLNYNMEETNKIREELGMKPLSRDKFPSLSSPSTRETKSSMKKTHTLDAVLLLLNDLDEEELHIVHTATQNRLQTYTLDSETLQDSLQSQKTSDIQH
ncbi:cilia and flagella associated protein 410 [Xiphias gladius]|uniref:cilia and flagella associated protein 410 n=1 Tax=Xiphias gladius TaxID=8245 RepID=UPI001A97D431|nr:cilia and flagella associated protein 410 [Xiphias gladius]XP_039999940.1 cilia and flagella associated protein 410 [Xiphias gladius]XP_039999942.1 cilia and flagella associated protein 410 [Xiphias gladius]XP_039999943.1 cilia and flagella associated protein 410 [Xiphias gladius]